MIARRSRPILDNQEDVRSMRHKNGKDARPDIDVSKISLRHDLPLVNWTVVVKFRDRPDERLPVQARDPLSAARLVSYTSERHWPADKLLAIESIHPVQGRP